MPVLTSHSLSCRRLRLSSESSDGGGDGSAVTASKAPEVPIQTTGPGSALVTVVHDRSSAARLRNPSGKGPQSGGVCA